MFILKVKNPNQGQQVLLKLLMFDLNSNLWYFYCFLFLVTFLFKLGLYVKVGLSLFLKEILCAIDICIQQWFKVWERFDMDTYRGYVYTLIKVWEICRDNG